MTHHTTQRKVQHVMTATKTETLTPEAIAIEAAASTQLAYADATALQTRRHASLNAAETALAKIEAEWADGIDTTSALDFAVANAEVLRATSLCEVADLAVVRTDAARTSVDVSLAELVKPFVEAALPGVPVSACFLRPSGKPDSLPAAYILQSSLPEIVDGHSTGSVEIHYFRTKLHAELDGVAVQEAGDFFAPGMRLSVGAPYSRTEGGCLVDVAKVRLQYDAPRIPVTPSEPTEALANKASAAFAQAFAALTLDPNGEQLRLLKGGAYASASASVRPGVGQVVNTEVDASGNRHSTIVARVTFWDVGGRRSRAPLSMTEALKTTVRDFVSAHTQGLGTCMAATLASKESPEYSGVTNASITLVYMNGAL